MTCKYCKDEFCINTDCPVIAYCPCAEYVEICRFYEEESKTNKLTIKETETYKEFDILIDDTIIGSAEIKYPDMELRNLHIRPDYQNKGFGTQVVKVLVNDYGIKRLCVSAENKKARHIYEKCGFIISKNPNSIEMKINKAIEN